MLRRARLLALGVYVMAKRAGVFEEFERQQWQRRTFDPPPNIDWVVLK